MLKSTRPNTYQEFRLPYWDWRQENQRSTGISLFTADRLGLTVTDSRFNNTPQVTGDLFTNENPWRTICWFCKMNKSIPEPLCNPNDVNGRVLQRCPQISGRNPCALDNKDWPTIDDVNYALGKSTYDASNFNKYTNKGFRNFLEGFVPATRDECTDNRFCDTGDFIARKLHNTVSLCH